MPVVTGCGDCLPACQSRPLTSGIWVYFVYISGRIGQITPEFPPYAYSLSFLLNYLVS